MIADYASRVGAVHVKDARRSVIARSKAQGLTYQETVVAGLWVEPGQGDLGLVSILEALPPDFAGWLIV
ncbi:MAG TPA: hypothetical protein VME46_12810 [Acidimicrobiales bacterium]|nr:hypothetical protein [Acidimicrobiales bacterium]